MEKMSSIERVVGKISQSEKEQILLNQKEKFDEQVFEKLKGKERQKTPEELEIISLVNDATNELRQKYGLENFDIPAKNFHIIRAQEWWHKDIAAFYNSGVQAVAAQERPEKMVFARQNLHEMVHFKYYHALQMTTGEKPELHDYREGLKVKSRDGKKTYFTNLDEAVTEEITKKIAVKLFDNPVFDEERAQTEKTMKEHPILFTDNTYYARKEPNQIKSSFFTYQQERVILNTLIGKILEKNPEKFQDKEEVFEVFAKGMMTGNILPAGKLIDRTFGAGTLRQIGELDQDIEAQEDFVNSL